MVAGGRWFGSRRFERSPDWHNHRYLWRAHDFDSGIDLDSFTVTADFPVDGIAPGQTLALRFKPTTQGVRELKLLKPIAKLPHGMLTVSVKHRQGNVTRIVRSFSVE